MVYRDETALLNDLEFSLHITGSSRSVMVHRVRQNGQSWTAGVRKGHLLMQKNGDPAPVEELPLDKLFTRKRFRVFYKDINAFEKDCHMVRHGTMCSSNIDQRKPMFVDSFRFNADLVPSTWRHVLGTKSLVPRKCYQVHRTKYLVPGA